VVQNLSDFAQAAGRPGATDESVAAFTQGYTEREAWPYQVDLRGAGAEPAELWAAAARADAVYLTDYLPGGGLNLRLVGNVRPALGEPAAGAGLAVLGPAPGNPALTLLAASLEGASSSGLPRLRLVWQAHTALPADAGIFVHAWQAGTFQGGIDGDGLGNLLPLWAWQPGWVINDLRDLSLAPAGLAGLPAGEYALSVGVYHRWDGTRLPAYQPDGQRWPDDAIPAGTLIVPTDPTGTPR
jgi:hypothetical protein